MWKANCRPYFRDKEGNKIFRDVRDNVPYLNSWPENISVPARPVPTAPAAGRPRFHPGCCQGLLTAVKFKKDPIQRAVVKGGKAKSEGIILGVFAHGGIQGVTRKQCLHTGWDED